VTEQRIPSIGPPEKWWLMNKWEYTCDELRDSVYGVTIASGNGA